MLMSPDVAPAFRLLPALTCSGAKTLPSPLCADSTTRLPPTEEPTSAAMMAPCEEVIVVVPAGFRIGPSMNTLASECTVTVP